MVLVAGFFDMLDGALARRINRVTHFGALLDSTLDRLAEGGLLLAILFLFAQEGSTIGVLLAGGVLIASLLVSYIRARAEALGLECTVGLFTRPERVIVLALGLLLGGLEIALSIIAALSLLTVGQRLVYVWHQVKDKKF
jgi:CDP-diacylglycerol--glycerol-3-phosphate 3-phosphatidyltransferase